MIRVQREDFDVGAELAGLTHGNRRIGGVASFVGLVRDMAGGAAIGAMTLEHYPGMTEKKLAEIEEEARRRWTLEAAALASCAFLIDWLKTQAPFWKLEETPDGGKWVEARKEDADAGERWSGE